MPRNRLRLSSGLAEASRLDSAWDAVARQLNSFERKLRGNRHKTESSHFVSASESTMCCLCVYPDDSSLCLESLPTYYMRYDILSMSPVNFLSFFPSYFSLSLHGQ